MAVHVANTQAADTFKPYEVGDVPQNVTEQQPEVAPDRIGFSGFSMGGTLPTATKSREQRATLGPSITYTRRQIRTKTKMPATFSKITR
jgi:hypothetical protein